MLRIQGPKDFWAGTLFIAAGAFTVTVASQYPMGFAARMGPGYFPRALGTLLMILGAMSVVRSFQLPGDRLHRWRWRPLVVALGSVVVFGLIVQHAGLAISTSFLVIAASAASHEFRPAESVVSSLLMAVLCAAVFVYALHIQIPLWPQFG